MNDNNLITNDYGHAPHCADVDTIIQPLTEQLTITPSVIPAGPTFVKIPVVIAETNVTIPVEATIRLDEEAIEIKRIRKNVYLTQSRVIPDSQDNRPGTAILYISGFIRKNIEYATKDCHKYGSQNVCGDIRHCTVQVPFNFTTRITFRTPPVFLNNSTPTELEFFTDKLHSCDGCADPVIGRNPCDRSSFFTEWFNEKPFTELVRADIAEVDINTYPDWHCKNPIEQKFTKVTEKVVVNLTLKVLQNQQVRVQSLGPATV